MRTRTYGGSLKGNKYSKFSILLTILIVFALFLAGPASALTVLIENGPNNANRGSDVSFDVTVEINSQDAYLPIKYTNLLFTGPNSFSKTCEINPDGSDNCADVDVTIISTSNFGYGYGYGYGYDAGIGYGYNFGYGYGYGYNGASGAITYHVVYHTPSDLTTGTYNAKANVYVESQSNNHLYSSTAKSFTISAPSVTTTGGDGGGYWIPTTVSTPATVITSGAITEAGKTVSMSLGDTTTFSIAGESHSAKLKSIGTNHVVLTISSDPFDVTINTGETKNVDANADGKNDLGITLNSIINGKADITFKAISTSTPTTQPIVTPTTEAEETTTPPSTTKPGITGAVIGGITSVYGISAIILIALILIAFLVIRKKK